MSVQSSEAEKEKRAKSLGDLHTLVETRTETLSLYNQLAAMRPYKPEHNLQMALQEFCEALVDYTASAHFQLYRFIEEGKERRHAVLDVAKDVYPGIAQSTSKIIDFNDNYDCEDHCDDMSHLADDLSELGEILADRIQWEDQVIKAFQGSLA